MIFYGTGDSSMVEDEENFPSRPRTLGVAA